MTEINFKEIMQNSAGTSKSKIYRAGVNVLALRQNFFFLREISVLLLRTFTDWIRSTHIMENNLSLKSTDCRC